MESVFGFYLTLAKGSKLKPDAPEFVPLRVQFESSNPKSATKIAKEEKSERKAALSMEKKAAKRAAKHVDGPNGMYNL